MQQWVKYVIVGVSAGGIGLFAGTLVPPIIETRSFNVSNRLTDVDFSEISLYTKVHVIFKHTIETKPMPNTQFREFKNFAICYDQAKRIPMYTIERISTSTLQNSTRIDRRNHRYLFDIDTLIHRYFRSESGDYTKSGYTRGHMAAARNHTASVIDYAKTFLMSNIAPQLRKLNGGLWNQLENNIRKLANKHKCVYICSGPLFMPFEDRYQNKAVNYKVIGRNDVAVPTHFFKYIRAETHDGRYKIESYILPNCDFAGFFSINRFQVSPEKIEKSAGFLFMEDEDMQRNIVTINGQEIRSF